MGCIFIGRVEYIGFVSESKCNTRYDIYIFFILHFSCAIVFSTVINYLRTNRTRARAREMIFYFRSIYTVDVFLLFTLLQFRIRI